jgi:hypothetical protein
MSLKIIGVGLPRTDTASLGLALGLPEPDEPFPGVNRRSDWG